MDYGDVFKVLVHEVLIGQISKNNSAGCPQWTLSSPPVFDSKAAEGSSTLWSGDSFRIREEKIFLKVYNICYNACDPVWRLFDVFAVQAGINLVSIDQ